MQPTPVTPDQHRDKLQDLCRRFGVKSLYLFGSGASQDFRAEHSDLDFLVTFAPSSPREHADRYFGLLDELRVMFDRNIDLVEEDAIENPYLLHTIEASRRLIYEAA